MARYEITDGPSKFDLMLALFKKDEQVDFTIPDTIAESGIKILKKVKVWVNSIGVEDGSRERWLLEGYVSNIEIVPSISGIIRWTNLSPRPRFRGYFDSRTRKGWIEL